MAAAVESGTLVPSKVGGGNLKELAAAAGNTRRTSSSVLLDAGVQAAHPRLKAMAQALQSRGQRVREGGREAGRRAAGSGRCQQVCSKGEHFACPAARPGLHDWLTHWVPPALPAPCPLPLQLVGHSESASSWGAPGKLPLPGQYCYESLQMARYEQGQHFLAHEVRRRALQIAGLALGCCWCCGCCEAALLTC